MDELYEARGTVMSSIWGQFLLLVKYICTYMVYAVMYVRGVLRFYSVIYIHTNA